MSSTGCQYCGDSIRNGPEVCDGSVNCDSNCIGCVNGYAFTGI